MRNMQSAWHSGFVWLSIGMAIFVAYVALRLTARVAHAPPGIARYWLAGGGVALGTGIWAMHFIGMVALELPIQLTYSIPVTLLSLGIAIATSLFALSIASGRQLTLLRLSVSALVMGGGISAMHYLGMRAIQILPMIRYERGLFLTSFVIAIAASFAGLWLAFRLRSGHSWQLRAARAGAAVLMGLAISGMHYTGMAASIFSPFAYCSGGVPLDDGWFGAVLGVVGFGLLTVTLITTMFDARLESKVRSHIDDLDRVNARLHHLALHDGLTGLPNRAQLLDAIDRAIAAADAARPMFAVLSLDLDRFKTVNESLGYGAGDHLLLEVARRLGAVIRGGDTLARSGGDEFVLLMSHVDELADIERLAERILREFTQPFDVGGKPLHTTPSIGISVYPSDGATPDSLLARSQEGVQHAKKLGRNTYRFFGRGMSTFTRESLEVEYDLRHALERNEYRLYYQPKVDAASGRIIGVEALLRWQHPAKGMIPPDRFIPLLEETGLILPVGEWVLREACQQARRWQDAGLPFLRMAVNLSATQFRQSRLYEVVREALADASLPADVLELELTESSIMNDPEESAAILAKLSSAGVLVSIDDFGKGYSSMSYLQKFPIDKLKIDRSFVSDLTVNPDSAAIVKAIISLAHSLRLKVVAEGVESYGQLDFLKDLECDHYQGYLCSRPVPPAELAQLVDRLAGGADDLDATLRTHSKLTALAARRAALS